MASQEAEQVVYWLHKQRDAGITFLVLGCAFTVLRFGVRIFRRDRKQKPWGWDDSLTIPSLLSIITLSVLTIGER